MQKMGHRMMPLDGAATIDIDGDANSFARFRGAPLCQGGTMDENVAAFLRVGYVKLSNFGTIMPGNVQQSMIADLSAHLGVTRRSIENDIKFCRLLPGQDRFDHRFRLDKIVSEKFRWRDSQILRFDTNRFLFLGFAGAVPLLFH